MSGVCKGDELAQGCPVQFSDEANTLYLSKQPESKNL